MHHHADSSFFAATPPLEAKRVLFSTWAKERQRNGQRLLLHFLDVKKAYFYAPSKRRVFIEIPWEDRVDGKGDVVGLLKRSLYGTRDAAAN